MKAQSLFLVIMIMLQSLGWLNASSMPAPIRKQHACCMKMAAGQKEKCPLKKACPLSDCTNCSNCPLVMSYILPAGQDNLRYFVYRSVINAEFKQDQLPGFNVSVWRPPAA